MQRREPVIAETRNEIIKLLDELNTSLQITSSLAAEEKSQQQRITTKLTAINEPLRNLLAAARRKFAAKKELFADPENITPPIALSIKLFSLIAKHNTLTSSEPLTLPMPLPDLIQFFHKTLATKLEECILQEPKDPSGKFTKKIAAFIAKGAEVTDDILNYAIHLQDAMRVALLLKYTKRDPFLPPNATHMVHVRQISLLLLQTGMQPDCDLLRCALESPEIFALYFQKIKLDIPEEQCLALWMDALRINAIESIHAMIQQRGVDLTERVMQTDEFKNWILHSAKLPAHKTLAFLVDHHFSLDTQVGGCTFLEKAAAEHNLGVVNFLIEHQACKSSASKALNLAHENARKNSLRRKDGMYASRLFKEFSDDEKNYHAVVKALRHFVGELEAKEASVNFKKGVSKS